MRLATNAETVAMLPVHAPGGVRQTRSPTGGAEYNAARRR